MFTWPIVLLVILGVSSLIAAGVMSIRLHVLQGDGEGHNDAEGVTKGP